MTNLALTHDAVSEPALAALLEASAAINASLDLSETLQAIARSAAEILRAEASSVLVLDRRRAKLIFKAAHGAVGAELIGQEFDAKLGIAGRVVSTGRPLLVPDVRAAPEFFGGIDKKASFTTRTMVVAPLRHKGQVIGVVEVINKCDEETFTEIDLQLLQIYANLAAISASNAQTHQQVIRENQGLIEVARSDGDTIGRSAALSDVMELCDRVAPTKSTVLLLGETGTGKELTARTIHARSQRAKRPFIGVNCAALPETLLESELFGHEAGAFTGAGSQKLGRFELADGGTLFLDEIGDISPSTQIKLLRVLQEREFIRVGGTRTVACDVRIIAATNRDLQKAQRDGQFREDLFYRLNVFPISLPPLRERSEDIPLLAEHFVDVFARQLGLPRPELLPEAAAMLSAHRWPGNIRELRNVIERAVLLADGGQIAAKQLPREITGELDSASFANGTSPAAGYEKALIVKALRDNSWNQTRTAQALGLSRDNLRYRLRKYQIRRPGGEHQDA